MIYLAFQLAAAACVTCHPAQVEAHSRTGHAAALSRASDHPFASRFRGGVRQGDWRFDFSSKEVRIHDGRDLMVLPVEWAFGAGQQAVTFVSRVDKDTYIEHAYSFYTALGGFARTPGHEARRPASIAEAAGVLYKAKDPASGIDACFDCHTTDSRPGVQCEACHASSPTHFPSLRALSANKLNDFCGKCHRPPASDPAKIDWSYAWNVRHQPVYLDRSACFQKSRGKLSCTTCHPAHLSVTVQASTSFNTRCVSCHAPSKSCQTNCIDCHMPRVSPQTGLRFTNHWIGVYGGGSNLKPRR
ncbi:MAG: hypothetical protein HY820_05680 [Acidobacteria bacterium]|nr:hypothetical protein [Acidobacteriota bacterium]